MELSARVEEALSDISDDMVVRLRFHGACSSCSMSAMTLKAGIEQTILKMVPEIKRVVAVAEDEV